LGRTPAVKTFNQSDELIFKTNRMEKPFIAARMPAQVSLEPGIYVWCSCGKSTKQPFCDGTHDLAKYTPVIFKIEEKKDAWLCQCKHSKNPPYCDGTHKTL
jgi:CDGSH-type Zn-finger protein